MHPGCKCLGHDSTGPSACLRCLRCAFRSGALLGSASPPRLFALFPCSEQSHRRKPAPDGEGWLAGWLASSRGGSTGAAAASPLARLALPFHLACSDSLPSLRPYGQGGQGPSFFHRPDSSGGLFTRVEPTFPLKKSEKVHRGLLTACFDCCRSYLAGGPSSAAASGHSGCKQAIATTSHFRDTTACLRSCSASTPRMAGPTFALPSGRGGAGRAGAWRRRLCRTPPGTGRQCLAMPSSDEARQGEARRGKAGFLFPLLLLWKPGLAWALGPHQWASEGIPLYEYCSRPLVIPRPTPAARLLSKACRRAGYGPGARSLDGKTPLSQRRVPTTRAYLRRFSPRKNSIRTAC